jgi:hypothetical protein
MTFEDRRLVTTPRLPYRITTQANGETVDDLRFTQVLVNQPLSREDFER